MLIYWFIVGKVIREFHQIISLEKMLKIKEIINGIETEEIKSKKSSLGKYQTLSRL